MTPPPSPDLATRLHAVTAQKWEWRLALNHGFWDHDARPTFHARGPDHMSACDRGFGLHQSIEEPNEGSHLCPDCMVAARRNPTPHPASCSSSDLEAKSR